MGNNITNIYAGAHTGVVRTADKANYNDTSVTLGAKHTIPLGKKDAIYGKAEAGAGNAMRANLALGYEHDFGKGIGLDVSANADMRRSFTSTKDYEFSVANNAHIRTNEEDVYYSSWANTSMKTKNGETSFSGKALLKKKTSWGEYGAGVEAGYRHSLAPKLTFKDQSLTTLNDKVYDNSYMSVTTAPKDGVFVDPMAYAKVNVAKHLDINCSVSPREARVGINYNF